jgi:hypothetical protein
MAVGAAMRGSLFTFGAAAANRLSPSLAAAFCGRCADDAGADDAAQRGGITDSVDHIGAKTKNRESERTSTVLSHFVVETPSENTSRLFCLCEAESLYLRHHDGPLMIDPANPSDQSICVCMYASVCMCVCAHPPRLLRSHRQCRTASCRRCRRQRAAA